VKRILHSHFLSNRADDSSADGYGRAFDGGVIGVDAVVFVDVNGLKCVEVDGVG